MILCFSAWPWGPERGEHGNIGPASVPIVLSKLRQLGKLKKGDRVALMGIGSGLNCTMAEVVW